MRPDKMFVPPDGSRPDLSQYSAAMIEQAIGEVRGLARSMSDRGLTLTAAQLRCLCDLAEVHLLDAHRG